MHSSKLQGLLEAINADRQPARAPSHDERAPRPLSEPGPLQGEESTTHSGSHLRIRRPILELGVGPIEPPLQPAALPLSPLTACWPGGLLFLDLETCGLSGAAIFLAGMIRADGEELVCEQLLARTYGEEASMLEALWERVALARVLVTFNGRRFDWPMVMDRSTRHRLPAARRDPTKCPRSDADRVDHVDILHPSRRQWGARLPNCRLQTLEGYLLGRVRHGDIPGWQIPDAYHEFVRTGRPDQMRAILDHNALDLVSLAQIARLLIDETAVVQ